MFGLSTITDFFTGATSHAQVALSTTGSWLPAAGWYVGTSTALALAAVLVIIFLKSFSLGIKLGIGAAVFAMFAFLAFGYEGKGENKIIPQLNAANATISHNLEMQAALKSSNEALTLQAKQSLIKALQSDTAKNQVIQERIKNDTAAKAIVVPADTVRLLNDSAAIGRSDHTGTPETISGNASSTDTPATSNEGFTLQDIESTSATNNINHWACIKVVEAWQTFWKKFSDNVGRVEAISGSP
jgi:hypothetical protein